MTEQSDDLKEPRRAIKMNRFDLIQSHATNTSLIALSMMILVASQARREDPDLVFVVLAFSIFLANLATFYYQTKKLVKDLKEDYDAREIEILQKL